jgi:hypothetical protein
MPRASLLTAAVLLLTLSIAPAISAQVPGDGSLPNEGFWLGASVAANRPLVSSALAQGWERVGQLGVGIGAALSAGYDASRVGFGLEFESTNAHIGSRPGRNVAAAVVLRLTSPWQPLQSWPARLTAGYVRYGLGGAYVMPSELPAGYFHSEPSPFPDGERLMLLGNGLRLGIEGKHALSERSAVTIALGGDMVQFGSATYQHVDQTLTRSGWSVIPRLAVGFVVGRGLRP